MASKAGWRMMAVDAQRRADLLSARPEKGAVAVSSLVAQSSAEVVVSLRYWRASKAVDGVEAGD